MLTRRKHPAAGRWPTAAQSAVTEALAVVLALALALVGCRSAAAQPAGAESDPVAAPEARASDTAQPEARPPTEVPAEAQPMPLDDEQPVVIKQPPAEPLPPSVVARVNGEDVQREALVDVLLKHYGGRALEAMIQQLVVQQEAARLNIEISDKELEDELTEFYTRGRFQPGTPISARREQWLQMLASRGMTEEDFKRDMKVEALLKKLTRRRMTITDEQVRAEFDRRHGERLMLSQIVVATEAEAKEIHEKLKAGEEFAALARTRSTDQRTKADGGKLPQPLGRGTVRPEIEAVAFGLEVNQFSEPLKVGTGWYILKLDSLVPPQDVKFDDVKDRYREELAGRMEPQQRGALLQELMGKAKIQRGPLVGGDEAGKTP